MDEQRFGFVGRNCVQREMNVMMRCLHLVYIDLGEVYSRIEPELYAVDLCGQLWSYKYMRTLGK